MSGLRRCGRERTHDTCLVVRGVPRLLTDHMTEFPLVRAPRIPVTDTFHGVDVTEDYRWLEDASSEETIAWARVQQHRSRTYFGGIPWRDALRARVEQLKSERTTYKRLPSGGSTFFALKVQTPRQQPFLVALTDLDDPATERVVVDPDVIDPSGETTIDFFVPSPDGKQVAVSLSEHGTEDGSLHVYDVESGEVVDEPIAHVNLMGGSVAWRHDGSGFWYTRCADPAVFRQQVWFRELGDTPDRVDLAGPFADERIAENYLSASPDGRWVMDRVQRGDGGEWQVFLRSQGAGGSWWQVADIPDKCVHAVPGTDALYLLSFRDAPHGKVLRLPLTSGTTVADADEIVSAGDTVAEELGVVALRSSLDAGTGPDRLVVRVLHRAGDLVGSSLRRSTPANRTEDGYPRRPVRVRGDPRVRNVEGRYPCPPQRDRRTRHATRRNRAGAADRVRRLQHLAGTAFRSRAAAVAGAGRSLRGGQHPRRRRVRRGVAPRRPARHQAELLRRLHRLRGPSP